MTLQAWQTCVTVRDCECCGARGGLRCEDASGHDGIHVFRCLRCGRDRGCWN